MSDSMEPRRTELWGKYRGKVLNNIDPLKMGRLLVEVPQVPATRANWATPCVPYAGSHVGWFAMPDIGATVWVEYEHGDPSYPIWTGCYWLEGEAPTADPLHKVLRTTNNMLEFDDTPKSGGITMTALPPAVETPVTLTFSSEGMSIKAPPGEIEISTKGGITIKFPAGEISMTTEKVTISVPASSLEVSAQSTDVKSPEVSIHGDATVDVKAGAQLGLKADGSVEVSGAQLDIKASARAAINGGGMTEIKGGLVTLN